VEYNNRCKHLHFFASVKEEHIYSFIADVEYWEVQNGDIVPLEGLKEWNII
jgi:hypothetical protein